ncbi:MFS transporter [Gordonia sp. CPCC 205515]|uniref:MFS transporter n=1 Tax=Gordonia sp. CPCC 205515 TaxID=3140791 RepID=UPI003AF370CD
MTEAQRFRIPAYVSVAILSFVAIAADGYDLGIFGAAVPDLLTEPGWGLTTGAVGVIASTALLGACVGSIAAGVLTDRFGARRLFLAAIIWFSVGMIACALAPNPAILAFARLATGFGLGGLAPAAIALTFGVAPELRRNFINGVMLTGLPIGTLIAALTALALLADTGWRGVFFIGGVVPLLLIVPIGMVKLKKWAPDAPRGAEALAANTSESGPRVLLHGRNARMLTAFVAITFCCQLLSFGLLTWLPQIMKSAGFSLGSSLVFLSVFSLGAVVGTAGGARIADRIGPRSVTIAGFALGALGILTLAINPPQPILYLALLLAGAGTIGMQPVVYGYAAQQLPAQARGTTIGVIGGVGRIGGVCGPILGGFLAGLPAFANFAGFAAIALVAALLAERSTSTAVSVGDPIPQM